MQTPKSSINFRHLLAGSSTVTVPGDVSDVTGGKPGGAKKSKPRPRGRSPSVYYSPGANKKPKTTDTSGDQETTAKTTNTSGDQKKHPTAAKSAPKPPAEKPKPRSHETTKVEKSPVDTVTVQAALNRANTVDIPAQEPSPDQDGEASSVASGVSDDECSQDPLESTGLEPDTQPETTGGPTLDQVRKKREAHARFMRFSRSLKSFLVANKLAKLGR